MGPRHRNLTGRTPPNPEPVWCHFAEFRTSGLARTILVTTVGWLKMFEQTGVDIYGRFGDLHWSCPNMPIWLSEWEFQNVLVSKYPKTPMSIETKRLRESGQWLHRGPHLYMSISLVLPLGSVRMVLVGAGWVFLYTYRCMYVFCCWGKSTKLLRASPIALFPPNIFL